MRVVLVIVLFVATGLITLWLVPRQKPLGHLENQPELPVESSKQDIRDVTPDNALPGPEVSGKLLKRLPDKKKPRAKTVELQIQNFQNLIVTSAGILKTGDRILQIRDIKPLKLDALCQTENGQSWPCGRFARTALRQLILKHTIQCESADETITPMMIKCQIGKRDIGKWLVERGWAKSAGDIYASEMAVAKKRQQGMWRKNLP